MMKACIEIRVKITHDVRLGGEFVSLQAFQSHPFHRQLDSALVVYAVVFLIVHVSGQAKVSHLHCVTLVQPAGQNRPKIVVDVTFGSFIHIKEQ